MKTIPWEAHRNSISDEYIAGFLDGDGSIVVHIEKRPDRRRFPYRVRLKINFTQHVRHKKMLQQIQKTLGGIGNIRDVKTHNLAELVVQKRSDVKAVLLRIAPHLLLKKKQARVMLEIIEIFERGVVHIRSSLSDKDLEKIFSLGNVIRNLNSGTGGKKYYSYVAP